MNELFVILAYSPPLIASLRLVKTLPYDVALNFSKSVFFYVFEFMITF